MLHHTFSTISAQTHTNTLHYYDEQFNAVQSKTTRSHTKLKKKNEEEEEERFADTQLSGVTQADNQTADFSHASAMLTSFARTRFHSSNPHRIKYKILTYFENMHDSRPTKEPTDKGG